MSNNIDEWDEVDELVRKRAAIASGVADSGSLRSLPSLTDEGGEIGRGGISRL